MFTVVNIGKTFSSLDKKISLKCTGKCPKINSIIKMAFFVLNP